MRLPSIWSDESTPTPFKSDSLFNQLFQDMEKEFFDMGFGRFGNTDIYEEDGSVHYEIEMPGMNKEDIKVRTRDNRLVVTGKVSQEDEKKDKNYISKGRRYGRFQRTFPLPEEIEDPNDLTAKFENGILHVQAPLRESSEEEDVVDVTIE
ncbi:MAG: Hsp20/alpha crystallin family protein [Candidatus Acetothermia bacterium]